MRISTIVLLLVLLPSLSARSQPTLYYDGHIYTADSSRPFIGYFTVEGGVITATGQDLPPGGLERFARRVDLGARTVIPGIIDSHIHFIDGGLGLLQTSFAEARDTAALKSIVAATRDRLLDGIYVGRNLGYEPLEGVDSPIAFLDREFPDVPAVIFMKSGHAAVANTRAMRLFGFSPGSSVADGTIGVDGRGNLNGYLLEGAAMEANKTISSRYSGSTVSAAILKAQALALSYGITTIGDNTFSPYFLKIYQRMQVDSLLRIRVRGRSYGRIPQTDVLMSGLGRPKLGFIGGGVDFERVRYHAVKYFEDMSLSTSGDDSTAARPGGPVFLDGDQLHDIFLLHPRSTMAFHVQGKEGLENILSTLRSVGGRLEPHRHVIDHAGYASGEQLAEIRDLGLGLTMIGGQTFDYENLVAHYRNRSASDRATPTLVEDDLLNMGLKYRIARGALTSDFPYGMDTSFVGYPRIDGLDPFPMIAVNVTGRYPDGREVPGFREKTLSLRQAVDAYTTNGAFVLGEEGLLGKIAPGCKADFVILHDDIFVGDPMRLYDARVDETYIDGQQVYTASGGVIGSAGGSPTTYDVSPTDYTLSPVIGYDPALGLILGGAAFVFPLQTPGNYADVQLQAIMSGRIDLSVHYTRYELFRGTDLRLSGSFSNYFQYYFGEGDTTSADAYDKVYSNIYRVQPELDFGLTDDLTLGAFLDLRGRRETSLTTKDDVEMGSRLAPDERTVSGGASITFDTRDNTVSTKKGEFLQASAAYVPAFGNVDGLGGMLQLATDLRLFRYIYTSDYVIAARLTGGVSFGTPSYLYRYTLGGNTLLRGYYGNRFRGSRFVAGQIEGRFPLYGRFSGVVFVDAGDIGDSALEHIRYTYGGGLRFALGNNLKLRLDYGVAKDQNGVFFSFSEAF